jgi:hypothetical protein
MAVLEAAQAAKATAFLCNPLGLETLQAQVRRKAITVEVQRLELLQTPLVAVVVARVL